VPARRAKSDQVIWEKGHYRITVVNFLSPMIQKKRAQEAGLLTLREIDGVGAPYCAAEELDDRFVHIFLLYFQNRITGFLIIEYRSHINKYSWEEYDKRVNKDLIEQSPIWSVGMVWIHKHHRRKGLSRPFIIEATAHLGTDLQSVGWYTPFSESGEAMVRRLCPGHFLIAK